MFANINHSQNNTIARPLLSFERLEGDAVIGLPTDQTFFDRRDHQTTRKKAWKKSSSGGRKRKNSLFFFLLSFPWYHSLFYCFWIYFMDNELLRKELQSLKGFIDTLSSKGILYCELSDLHHKLSMKASPTNPISNMWTIKVKLINSNDREVIRIPNDSTIGYCC